MNAPTSTPPAPLVDPEISTAANACIQLLDSAAIKAHRSAASTARWNAFLASQGVTPAVTR